MKKAVVIVITVAVLGAVALHDATPSHSQLVAAKNGAASSQVSASSNPNSATASASYKDGTYTGATSDTPYGPVQIAVVISGGKITDVNFIQMPSDLAHSQMVTSVASPLLKQTTLQAQSANIEFVSGATSTSIGYEQSLQAALNQATI